jgi:phosphopantothenoylcysteine decarboxylase
MVTDPKPAVLHLVVTAAPPAQRIEELVNRLHNEGWDVHIIATPTAATWLPLDRLTDLTGHPVLHRQRGPDEPGGLPPATAVAVVPATFNTISKWATGANDSLALGVLNEALGLTIPVIASPYAKATLTSHPAFAHHLHTLASCGVHLTATEALRPDDDSEPFRWNVVLDILRHLKRA